MCFFDTSPPPPAAGGTAMHAVKGGGAQFYCSVCNACYGRESELNTHVRLRHGERPFSCPWCEKSYATEAQLRSHVTLRHANIAGTTMEQSQLEMAVKRGAEVKKGGGGGGGAVTVGGGRVAPEYDDVRVGDRMVASSTVAGGAAAADAESYDKLPSIVKRKSRRRISGATSHSTSPRGGGGGGGGSSAGHSSSHSSSGSTSSTATGRRKKRSASGGGGGAGTFASSQLTELTSEASSGAPLGTVAAANLQAALSSLPAPVALAEQHYQSAPPMTSGSVPAASAEYQSLPFDAQAPRAVNPNVANEEFYVQLELTPVDPRNAQSYHQTSLVYPR